MKRSEIEQEAEKVRALLREAGIPLHDNEPIEIADFGLGRYAEEGLGLVVRINEPEYCAKWLTLLPGQSCPWHYHRLKKETFFVLNGEVELRVDEKVVLLQPGDAYTIAPGEEHTFCSRTGAVIEEVSTHDENADSYFRDPLIVRDPIIEEN